MATEIVIDSKAYNKLENWKKAKFVEFKTGLYNQAEYTNPVNFPIQSTGADICKLALVYIVEGS